MIVIVLNQIPAIAGELTCQVFEKPLGTVKVKILVPTQHNAQNAIKPGKMIHVSVGHEDMGDFEDVPGRQCGNISQTQSLY